MEARLYRIKVFKEKTAYFWVAYASKTYKSITDIRVSLTFLLKLDTVVYIAIVLSVMKNTNQG